LFVVSGGGVSSGFGWYTGVGMVAVSVRLVVDSGEVGPAVSELRNAVAVGVVPSRRSGIEMSIVVQSIFGLVCWSQGSPRTSWADGWSLVIRKWIGIEKPDEN
jgi:hypothetical protein